MTVFVASPQTGTYVFVSVCDILVLLIVEALSLCVAFFFLSKERHSHYLTALSSSLPPSNKEGNSNECIKFELGVLNNKEK